VAKFGRAKQTTDDNIIQHMRFTYWTGKATDTLSEYEILFAFPRQQWLRLNFTLYYIYKTIKHNNVGVLINFITVRTTCFGPSLDHHQVPKS